MINHPVSWGIISCSGHYQKRLQIPLQQSSILKVMALASRDSQKAMRKALEWKIPQFYSSYQDLLADPDIEAVYLPLPNHLHYKWIMEALNRGKHVLCEKPFTLNYKEAEETFEEAEKRKLLLAEACMFPFHPQWQKARELIQIGDIGRLHSMDCHFSYQNLDSHNIRNQRDKGGGGLYDIGYYGLSAMMYLYGRAPQRVVSLIERDPQWEIDRNTSALLDFGSFHGRFTVSTQSFPFQRVSVIGSKGRIEIPLPFNAHPDVSMKLKVENNLGSRTIEFPPADQYLNMFEAFSMALRQKVPFAIQKGQTLNHQRVLDALFLSEKEKRWVFLDEGEKSL